jgi:hypothetical protein
MRADASGLTLELLAPARVPEGEPLRFTLRILNAGDRPANLYLQGRPPAFDLVVRDDAGRTVWRRLGGAVISMVLGVRELAPGEAVEFEGTWPLEDAAGHPVPPGRYRLTGVVPAEPDHELRSSDVRLEITSP